MIDKIDIHNFKIHANSTIELAPLTILTGINGMGKSSVTQAMLLLREAVRSHTYPHSMPIQTKAVNLGPKTAALANWFVEKGDFPDMFKISLSFDHLDKPLDFRFRYDTDSTDSFSPYPDFKLPETDKLYELPLFSDNSQYVSAHRSGPKDDYSINSNYIAHRQVSANLGDGDLTPAILLNYGTESIPVREAALPSENETIDNLRLDIQTALWLNRISPKVRFAVNSLSNSVNLVYNYPKKNGIRSQVAPVNTGFGVSYALSVIVALLMTKPGGLVIIENPEAHIHPAGQSALMELMSIVAQNGVQVIVETHSDHIVFGALVNMKKNRLQRDKLIIEHFDTDDADGSLRIEKVKIGDDCRIKNAPRHFVEQMNLDLDVLFDM